jgi:hypothetical protein
VIVVAHEAELLDCVQRARDLCEGTSRNKSRCFIRRRERNENAKLLQRVQDLRHHANQSLARGNPLLDRRSFRLLSPLLAPPDFAPTPQPVVIPSPARRRVQCLNHSLLTNGQHSSRNIRSGEVSVRAAVEGSVFITLIFVCPSTPESGACPSYSEIGRQLDLLHKCSILLAGQGSELPGVVTERSHNCNPYYISS